MYNLTPVIPRLQNQNFVLRNCTVQPTVDIIAQRWSPRGRPWPRGHILKSLALASKVKSLASKPQVLKNWPVLGSRTALFFEQLKFNWKTPKNSRKFCEYLFCFPLLEHRRTQRGQGSHSPPTEISPMTKMCQKAYCFFSFSFFLPFFADNSY